MRKNSIRLPSDRAVGTCLFGFLLPENPESLLGWQTPLLSREVEEAPADRAAGTGQGDAAGAQDTGQEQSERPIALQAQFSRELHLW